MCASGATVTGKPDTAASKFEGPGTGKEPQLARIYGRRKTKGRAGAAWLVMLLICAAQFVLQLDFSIVNVALPTIQRDLDMPAAQLQWIVTGYALTFGSLLLAGGRLADLVGRRRLLALGLSIVRARLGGMRARAMARHADRGSAGPGSSWCHGVAGGPFAAHDDQPGGAGTQPRPGHLASDDSRRRHHRDYRRRPAHPVPRLAGGLPCEPAPDRHSCLCSSRGYRPVSLQAANTSTSAAPCWLPPRWQH